MEKLPREHRHTEEERAEHWDPFLQGLGLPPVVVKQCCLDLWLAGGGGGVGGGVWGSGSPGSRRVFNLFKAPEFHIWILRLRQTHTDLKSAGINGPAGHFHTKTTHAASSLTEGGMGT